MTLPAGFHEFALDGYRFRGAEQADARAMMELAHEGLKPWISKLRGWDQQAEEAGFAEHFTLQDIVIVQRVPEAEPLQDVGYLKVLVSDDVVWLDGIYLHAAVRGEGLGAELIGQVNRFAQRRSAVTCLRVLRTNPARTLYQRLGFVDYDATETAFLMKLSATGKSP